MTTALKISTINAVQYDEDDEEEKPIYEERLWDGGIHIIKVTLWHIRVNQLMKLSLTKKLGWNRDNTSLCMLILRT